MYFLVPCNSITIMSIAKMAGFTPKLLCRPPYILVTIAALLETIFLIGWIHTTKDSCEYILLLVLDSYNSTNIWDLLNYCCLRLLPYICTMQQRGGCYLSILEDKEDSEVPRNKRNSLNLISITISREYKSSYKSLLFLSCQHEKQAIIDTWNYYTSYTRLSFFLVAQPLGRYSKWGSEGYCKTIWTELARYGCLPTYIPRISALVFRDDAGAIPLKEKLQVLCNLGIP